MYDNVYEEFKSQSYMAHSQSYQIPAPAGPAGENLAMASYALEPEAAVNMWYNEVEACGPFPGCKAGSGGTTGHFTALIWNGVQEIGCTSNSFHVLACRYKGSDSLDCTTPNMGGSYATNVFSPVKSRSECEEILALCKEDEEPEPSEPEPAVQPPMEPEPDKQMSVRPLIVEPEPAIQPPVEPEPEGQLSVEPAVRPLPVVEPEPAVQPAAALDAVAAAEKAAARAEDAATKVEQAADMARVFAHSIETLAAAATERAKEAEQFASEARAAAGGEPFEGGEAAAWTNIMKSHTKCERLKGEKPELIATLGECQDLGELEGRKYIVYEPTRQLCYSSPTCDRPVGTAYRWMIYEKR